MSGFAFPKSSGNLKAHQLLLAEARRKVGVNYEDLGGLTGLHATSLSLIERHLRKPTFVNLCRIASALRVRLSTIVRNAENQVRKDT